MTAFAAAGFFLVLIYLGAREYRRRVQPHVSALSSSVQAAKTLAQWDAIVPPGTRHATLGEAYLTDEVERVQTGLMDEFPGQSVLIGVDDEHLFVLDAEGGRLLRVELATVTIGLPSGYDSLSRPYFYFLFPSHALAIRHELVVRSGLRGDEDLGHWDGLL